jgi:hypothetical protein
MAEVMLRLNSGSVTQIAAALSIPQVEHEIGNTGVEVD